MDSKGSSSRKHPSWKYATQVPSNKNAFTCNFCAKETIEVFISQRNAKACLKCPDHVKREIREYMANKKVEKEQMNMLSDFDEADSDKLA